MTECYCNLSRQLHFIMAMNTMFKCKATTYDGTHLEFWVSGNQWSTKRKKKDATEAIVISIALFCVCIFDENSGWMIIMIVHYAIISLLKIVSKWFRNDFRHLPREIDSMHHISLIGFDSFRHKMRWQLSAYYSVDLVVIECNWIFFLEIF